MAKKIGEIKGLVHAQGEQKKIIIQNVLYVPGLQFNLLSVSKLEIKGYKILFDKGKGIIFKNNVVVAEATRNHRVYELTLTHCLHATIDCMVACDLELWHRRLGHVGYNNIKKMTGMVEGLKIKDYIYHNRICAVHALRESRRNYHINKQEYVLSDH